MAVISTGLLTKGLRSEFFKAFEGTETHWQDWATTIKSNADQEDYRWLGTTPPMREWGTGRLAKGLNVEAYNVKNLKYESTIEVDRDEISDDQTGQIRIRTQEMAEKAALHPDKLIADLLANGHSSGFLAYDGFKFFSGDHVWADSGTQDNDLTQPITDLNAPTTANMKASIQLAIAQLLTFKDDQGEPVQQSTGGLVVIVPPNMMFSAMEALTAAQVGNTSNVLMNVAKVIAFPWLSQTATWFLLKTDGRIRPFIFQDREPIEFKSQAENSDEEFRREKYLFGVRARYRMAYGLWQHAVRTIFT